MKKMIMTGLIFSMVQTTVLAAPCEKGTEKKLAKDVSKVVLRMPASSHGDNDQSIYNMQTTLRIGASFRGAIPFIKQCSFMFDTKVEVDLIDDGFFTDYYTIAWKGTKKNLGRTLICLSSSNSKEFNAAFDDLYKSFEVQSKNE